MKFKYILSVFLLFCITATYANRINILDIGGKNDGKFKNTAVIKKGIETLSHKGGGTLYFPAGTYFTGPIVMKSNITLYIEAGATLLFSDNYDDYLPYVQMRYEGVAMKSFCPFIYAYGQENIAIIGRGKLDGQGKKWWFELFRTEGEVNKYGALKNVDKYNLLWDKENPGLPEQMADDYKPVIKRRFFRPPFIQPYKCKNVLIEGVTITNSPFWTVNPEFCENVSIHGITIDNKPSPNTDGINPESCKNVHISDCHISVGDDCITIKSGRDDQGRKIGVPCENITITNCTMANGHGGVVIGSEMSGDVRKVAISNCVFDGTDRGIRIKSMRGRGGIVEEIRIDNIVMKNISKEAITVNLVYGDSKPEPVSDRTPIFRNIHISNLTGTKVNTACTVIGLDEMPISNLTFNNINIEGKSGFDIQMAKDIELNNVNVGVEMGAPFKLKNAENVMLTNVKTSTPILTAPVVKIADSKDVLIQSCYPLGGSQSFLQVEGAKTTGIALVNNYLDRLMNKVEYGTGVKATNIIVR